MNTPNKLTLLRIILIPVFVIFMLVRDIPNGLLFAFAVFTFASITDFVDGYLARRDHLVTDFGILMDPLADKLLVASALICFVEIGLASAFVVIIIISREFLVTSIRLVAAGAGKVIAADNYGKYKTATQMIWVSYAILMTWYINSFSDINPLILKTLSALDTVLMCIVVFLTVLSGVNYVIKNKEVFSQ